MKKALAAAALLVFAACSSSTAPTRNFNGNWEGGAVTTYRDGTTATTPFTMYLSVSNSGDVSGLGSEGTGTRYVFPMTVDGVLSGTVVTLRFKSLAGRPDITLAGSIEGQSISGLLLGGGYTGEPITLVRK